MPSIDPKLRDTMRKIVNSMVESKSFNLNEIVGGIISKYPISPNTIKVHINALLNAGIIQINKDDNLIFYEK